MEEDSVWVLPTGVGGADCPVGVGSSTLAPIVEIGVGSSTLASIVETGVGFVVSLWLTAISGESVSAEQPVNNMKIRVNAKKVVLNKLKAEFLLRTS